VSTPAFARARGAGYRGGAALPLLLGACAMTAGLALEGPLRAAIELPLALLLPGTSILVAARGARPARPASDVGLALVLTFAAWILIALTCYVAGQPFTTTAIVIGANLIVGSAAAVCLARGTPLTTLTGSTAGRAFPAPLLIFALAVFAVVGVIAAATRSVGAPAPYVQPYSEIALAGQWADVRSVVAVSKGAGPVPVELTVANHTQGAKTYEVVPVMHDASWGARTIELAAGATWRGFVSGRVPRGGCLHRLLVTVGEVGAQKPVGSVTLWFQNGTKLTGKCTK
jgi:hypothetical protein